MAKELPALRWRFQDYYSSENLDLWAVTVFHEYFGESEPIEGYKVPPTVVELSIDRGYRLKQFLELTAESILEKMNWAVAKGAADAEHKHNNAVRLCIANAEKDKQAQRKAGKPVSKHLR